MYWQMLSRQRELIKMKVTQLVTRLHSVGSDLDQVRMTRAKQYQLRRFQRNDYEMEKRFPNRRGDIK